MDSLPLSQSAQSVLNHAADESARIGHGFLGVEHLFSALSLAPDSSLRAAFADQGIPLEPFLAELIERIEPLEHQPWGDDVLMTPRCREVISLATAIAMRNRKAQVTCDHLLEAILSEGRSVPMRLLRARNARLTDMYEAIAPRPVAGTDTPLPLLDRFGRDLSAAARDGSLMKVIGRDAEIDRVMEILLRKRKNNPVLVGEAGVGKTAIVEGLAAALLLADDAHPLRHCRVIELSMASLVAGTKYRGEFEERMLGVMREAASDPTVILFFDEIHTLMGAGAAAGEAVTAAEIVKPPLARGDLRCIGATTIAEYRRCIERDAALDRRFESVMVEEPTSEQARHMLAELAPSLAMHHGVDILPEALDAAVKLTVRYVPYRRLPDKAIDAIDQSGARLRLGSMAGRGAGQRPALTAQAVACTVSQWTGIPLERFSGEDTRHFLGLEEQLRAAVLGQDHACSAVARAILTSKAGLADPDRPTGTFLFLGPSGVGKTELARSLARLLFGDEKRLVRFDMSEFMEPHSVAKLIGAPPGYVGHEQEGLLISAVRTHPDCVVLFDEMEKAHPQVFDLFLQIFDEGRLMDAHGKRADFRNAVIILTSNVDLRETVPPAPLGFNSERPAVQTVVDLRAELARYLRPELVNRIDEILLFNRLDASALRRIIDRYVANLEALGGKDLRIELSDEVYAFLIANGVSAQFGARELRRAIDRWIRQPLASELLRLGAPPARVRIEMGPGQLRFDFESATPTASV